MKTAMIVVGTMALTIGVIAVANRSKSGRAVIGADEKPT